MMDLDELKRSTTGSATSTATGVLRGVGEVIQSGVRQIDTAARYGGDEFVVLLPRPIRPARSSWPRRSGSASRSSRSRSPAPGSRPSLSVGVVSYPDDGQTADELMISADGAMYASKRAGKNRVIGLPGHDRSGEPTKRCSIRPCRSRDRPTRTPAAPTTRPRPILPRASRPGRSGPPTASRSSTSGRRRCRSTRPPRSRAADAEELGAVADRPAAGLRLRPDRQPDDGRARRARRRARGRRGRCRACDSGMAAIHAALASLLSGRRPGRRDDRRPTARRGPSSTGVFARLGVDVDVRRHHRPRRRRTRPSPRRRRRVLYAETIANPTIVVADHAALADLAHRHGATVRRRQHVRLAVSLPADRARRGPRRRVGDEVPRRPQRRPRRRRRRAAGPRRRRPERPGRHRRHARADVGVPRRCAASRRSRSGWTATRRRRRHSPPGSSVRTACRASTTRPSPAIPSTRSRRRQLAGPAAGCSRSSSRADATPAARSSTP